MRVRRGGSSGGLGQARGDGREFARVFRVQRYISPQLDHQEEFTFTDYTLAIFNRACYVL